jgi:2-aminoadipate transaminase
VIKEELELRQTFGSVAPGFGRQYDAPGPELT